MTQEPEKLAKTLSDLIALRGWARVGADEQLIGIWKQVAGEQFGAGTRVIEYKRGTLHVGVFTAPLLSELVSFHQRRLLKQLQTDHPHLKIKQLKFRLQSRPGQ